MMATVEQILLEKGSDVIGAAPTMTVLEAARKMIEAKVGSLVVEVEGKIMGIFTERDLLVRVVGDGRDPAETRINEVMSAPVLMCSPDDGVDEVADRLAAKHIRHMAVEDKSELVGMISVRDLLAAKLAED